MTATTLPVGSGQRVLTPAGGRVIRRSLFWVGVLVFVALIALVSIGTAGSTVGGAPLSATNAAPGGAMGAVEVLKQHGVTVTPTGSLADTRAAIGDPSTTTLFIYDDGLYLDESQLRQAVGLADTVVLVDATFAELRAVAPGVAQAGIVSGNLGADCPVAAVRKAGTVSGGGSGYRLVGDSSGTTSCLGSGDSVFSLIQLDGGRLTLLGATDALTNQHVIENGNAALALNLLGAHDNLVWYIPTFADVPAYQGQDLGSLTPAWVTPVLALLMITFVVAAIWRGRRLGPLVIENLPVTVRASETMLGRARLYERSSSRLRALDSLRIGAIGRLAALCGLPRIASVDEVAAAAASVTGRQVGEVRRVLVDDIPQTDSELVGLSDALLVLERDVARALRP
ncbi:MAG: hypothetical protein JWP19_2747 [Rhodoglobus sp.]|nr:hypothetical protein [Rhodoglobus sp.]